MSTQATRMNTHGQTAETAEHTPQHTQRRRKPVRVSRVVSAAVMAGMRRAIDEMNDRGMM